jgi:ADP-ribose pyrophosphatase YjhB (NUDIX family)
MPNTSRDRSGPEFVLPLTTVDVVILTIRQSRLQVLLVRRPDDAADPFPGAWALPGGFVDVDRDDTLEACALRKLQEKTSVRSPYLEQLGSWGGANRDPRGWSATHVYFALLPSSELDLAPGGNASDVRWAPVTDHGVGVPLAFDHAAILRTALDRVRGKTEYTSLAIHLLPREFTLTELQRAFEIVLGRPLEKKSFRTRILAADVLQPVHQLRETGRRPAQLYRAKRKGQLVYFPRALEQPRG